MAVGAEEDAGEDDFDVTGGDEGARLGDDVGERLGPGARAEARDDAVGAVRVAAVLHLDERALAAGLSLAEEREASCASEVFCGNFWRRVIGQRVDLEIDFFARNCFTFRSARACRSPSLGHPSIIPQSLRLPLVARVRWFGW